MTKIHVGLPSRISIFCVAALALGCEKSPATHQVEKALEEPTSEISIVAPGLISMEQVIATMGLEAKNRLSMRFAPLRTAGLSQAIVGLLLPNRPGGL